jgi:hypothetical protein
MNGGCQTTELISDSLIIDILFAGVQIAHPSRRQNDSRFLLCLEEAQPRDPEKQEQNDPSENRIHRGKKIESAGRRQSDYPQSKPLSSFNGT